ncbi:MAG: 3-oxoacyl-[acyl-carrier-protein] reductase [Acidimicrobiia bacterium]|nr:3-oxoacyl-[acyl-carrier-protein] reductase [Acidimicrobiia bacterium]
MTDNRVALVTGGSRGIGRAIAIALADAGLAVAVNYSSSADAASEVVAAIESRGGTAFAVAADVGDPDAVDEMFKAVTEALGPPAVLVNNAGRTADGLVMRMPKDDWDSVLRVDLTSVYLCTKAALRHMVRAKWGRVISIGSVSGIAGNPGQANYAAAKAGIMGFTKSVAKEVGSRGITANVVAPGFIETDMTDALDDSVRDVALGQITLGRFGVADEVAAAVAFLASDQASYITGHTLVVDGGVAL